MVNYKDLGLVNTREMFAKAIKGGYAIPAFNFNNMEQMQAIIKAAVETKSPVILQVSKGARQYANATLLRYMAQGAVEYAKELGCKHPEIVLHLDHGDTFETCKSCIDSGFSSVMIDGSHLPYEENVALTKKVVDYAHQFDVTVEGELGVLAGVEDEVSAEHHTYTNPEEVIDFATRTGCDSLAISIGTSHGAYKFKPEQCHVDPATGRLVPPPLEFAVLDAVMEKLPGFPIVLHGSSSVPQEYVDIINKFVFKVSLPVLLFKDIATTPIRDAFDPKFVIFCMVGTTIMFMGIWALTSIFMKDKSMVGAFTQASARGSAAVLGIAFVQNIYGNSGMTPLMIVSAVPLYNIYSVIILTFCANNQDHSDKAATIKRAFKNILTNPIIRGIAAGVPFSLLNIELPPLVLKTVTNVAQTATPTDMTSIVT